MKLIKKITNILLITVMLFTEFAPYAVMASANNDITTIGTKGQIYNPVTKEVSDSSVTVTENYDTGLSNNQGDITINKTIEKVAGIEGQYKVKFEIKGNQVTQVSNTTKNVYAVVVMDRSNSMKDVKNKWQSAKTGAITFADTLLTNIPTAQIALVGFSGNYYEDCVSGSYYSCNEWERDDATVLRNFVPYDATDPNTKNKQTLKDSDFGSPNGGTNIHAGLYEAKQLLDGITDTNAIKYVILIGDGSPNLYYDNDFETLGSGSGYDKDAGDAAIDLAAEIKSSTGTNAKIYAIGYDVEKDSDAENVLIDIANDTETPAGALPIKYYFNADATAVGGALTNIATSIATFDAGKDATITDTIPGSFTIINANGNKVTGDKVELSFAEITTSSQTLEFIIEIDPDSETGWHDTNAGFTLTYTDANNVKHENIKFNNNPAVYWVQNKYDYKVEYYYEDNAGGYNEDTTLEQVGTIHSGITTGKTNSVTVSSNGQTITIIEDSNEPDIINKDSLKEGYVFEKYQSSNEEDSASGSINIANNNNNVIKVYYKKIDLKYTVEHYLESDNGYEKVEADTETKNIHYGETATYTSNIYEGYSYISSKTEYNKTNLVVKDNELIIKLYYDKNEYGYVIRYHYEDIEGYVEEGNTADYNDTITVTQDMINSHNKTGYIYDHTNPESGSIVIKTSNNVIDVYYVKDDFKYTVEYYYDNVINNEKTETYTATYLDVIDSYEDKNITGYKFEKVLNKPLTITENESNNVIKVYYVKDDFKYTVEYYYDGTINSSKTEEYTATYLDKITTYTDKNITGYKLQKTENLPLTVSENSSMNIIKVYYVKDNFDYKVEHYKENLDGTYTKVETDEYNDVEFGSSATYEENVYTGYTYQPNKTVNGNATVPGNNSLVIKLYYDRNNYNYKVEHYLQNLDGTYTLDVTDRYDGKEFGSEAIYEENIYTGYTYNASKTVNGNTTVPANNDLVIELYYDRNLCTYKVEYYYDGTINDSKTDEFNNVKYGTIITDYTDKNITGYKFVTDENKPLEVGLNNEENIIKVYYEKDQYAYRVEYYYDGTIDNTKTETYTTTYLDTINGYTDKNKTGYKFEKTENLPLTISAISSDNVIKVYYVKDEYEYTVNYYYDGVVDESKTETYTATYLDEISTYIDKNKTGYKLEKTENLPLTISENSSNNVINVYYVKDSFGYSVEYYYDGIKNDSKTETYTATYLDKITTYTDKNITGYKLDKEESLPLTVSENSSNNVIKVYYVKDEYEYTVNYYYDGVIDESKTETYTATYLDEISTYIDKNITGYKLEKTENLPLTVTENESNNVIKVYYEKDTFGYSVEYYYDGIKNDSKTEVYTATYLDEISTYIDKNITGYKLEREENFPLTVTEIESNNVIKVYYKKDKFNYSVEYYYDGIIDNTKTETYIATYIDVITTYTDKVIDGYKFEKTENLPLNITEKNENNVIRIYYVKDNFDYTVEHYLLNLDGTYTLEETDVYTSVEYDSEASYEVNNYTGYTYNETKTINGNENVPANNDLVIKLYYDRNNYSYIVNHYVENILDNEYTLMDTDTYTNAIYGSEATYELNEYENCVYTRNEYIYNNEDVRNILTYEEIIANKLVPDNNNLVINVYYVRNLGKVTIHYVIKDVDTGSYIPFSVYGQDIDGNNTEDFMGIDLNDLIIEGKIGIKFNATGRNPIDYNFVGLYEGNLSDNKIVSINQEYTGSIENELELTFVYEAPYGEGEILPPQTGVEDSYASYLVYILFGVMITLTYSYIKASKKED